MPGSLIKKPSETEKSGHTGAPSKARVMRYKELINVPSEPTKDINPEPGLNEFLCSELFHPAGISSALGASSA